MSWRRAALDVSIGRQGPGFRTGTLVCATAKSFFDCPPSRLPFRLQGLQEKATFLKSSPQCAGNAFCKQVMASNVLSVIAVVITLIVTALVRSSSLALSPPVHHHRTRFP
eukprot:3629750-Pyramimonas_sp.AAC.2